MQAGYPTDSELVKSLLKNSSSTVHPETYLLQMPASPHIAAKAEGKTIRLAEIKQQIPETQNTLVIEGAGGVLVPLNENETVADLIKTLDASVIIISRNYLGSINHSLLTAAYLKQKNIKIIGWLFNDVFMNYEDDIIRMSGLPVIGSITNLSEVNRDSIEQQANLIRSDLKNLYE
ncbi:dethiobiotin synthase [soil metagenome]